MQYLYTLLGINKTGKYSIDLMKNVNSALSGILTKFIYLSIFFLSIHSYTHVCFFPCFYLFCTSFSPNLRFIYFYYLMFVFLSLYVYVVTSINFLHLFICLCVLLPGLLIHCLYIIIIIIITFSLYLLYTRLPHVIIICGEVSRTSGSDTLHKNTLKYRR